MLGKKDIEKELGKGINIYPFHPNNLKENSINLTAGQNAWTLGKGYVIKQARGSYSLATASERKNRNVIELHKGQSAVICDKEDKYLILLPHATTIIETSEVISVGNNIGGTFHSKVGIVDQGIGHIGTMLGPCFSGHLMFSLHNITDEVKTLKVGSTFVSLIFYYLRTACDTQKNSNISGHVDKLSELGIQIDGGTREFLTAEWKQDIKQVAYKMANSEEYINYVKMRKQENKSQMWSYVNARNIALFLIAATVIIVLAVGAYYIDGKNGNTVWTDRFWTVLMASVIAPLVILFGRLFKKK